MGFGGTIQRLSRRNYSSLLELCIHRCYKLLFVSTALFCWPDISDTVLADSADPLPCTITTFPTPVSADVDGI
jgi:hypothetical protein